MTPREVLAWTLWATHIPYPWGEQRECSRCQTEYPCADRRWAELTLRGETTSPRAIGVAGVESQPRFNWWA
jgi:hypothetical protein